MGFRAGTLGNTKQDQMLISIKNAEASASIPNGTPVAFVFNGTDDGLAVVLPSTGTATKATSLFAGIAYKPGGTTIVKGDFGQAVVSGVALNVKITLATRAASTASWSTYSAIAVGDILIVDTVNNALQQNAAGAASGFAPFAVAAGTVGSGSGTASTTASSATAFTTTLKVFVRAM